MHPPQLQTDPAWSPPEQDVHPAYQPVEVLLDGSGSWALGRINAWWRSPDDEPWCRLRLIGSAAGPAWRRYDPERILLLPTHGT
ncbi:hypothetical protein GCM10009759_06180 [Kitasatospora saccharophila]|uniref:Uncharacterized protein n=1 Tax=Kitasatospora saccharophila TaxID=407973 RepID=A0ABP5HSR7_9ACTN